MEPQVIYEDKHFLALNKPMGLLVHRARRAISREPALTDWLLRHYPGVKDVGDDPESRPGIVHRLDKETSGVLLVAKDRESFAYLKSLFKNREVKKTYLALVFGNMKSGSGVITKPIGIRSGTIKRSVHAEKMMKEAVTAYRVRKRWAADGEAYSLLEVIPETGRTHQIRVHLASIGHPVVGDRLYGARRSAVLPGTERLMLHALSIEFTAPRGARLKIEAEPPEDFKKVITSLGSARS